MAKLDKNGHEILDQTPVTLPVRVQSNISIDRNHPYSIQYDTHDEYETAEEADDFDVGDDLDPAVPWESSPYEDDTRNMILDSAKKEFDSKYLRSTAEGTPSRSPSDSAEGKKIKPGIKSSLPEEIDDA